MDPGQMLTYSKDRAMEAAAMETHSIKLASLDWFYLKYHLDKQKTEFILIQINFNAFKP